MAPSSNPSAKPKRCIAEIINDFSGEMSVSFSKMNLSTNTSCDGTNNTVAEHESLPEKESSELTDVSEKGCVTTRASGEGRPTIIPRLLRPKLNNFKDVQTSPFRTITCLSPCRRNSPTMSQIPSQNSTDTRSVKRRASFDAPLTPPLTIRIQELRVSEKPVRDVSQGIPCSAENVFRLPAAGTIDMNFQDLQSDCGDSTSSEPSPPRLAITQLIPTKVPECGFDIKLWVTLRKSPNDGAIGPTQLLSADYMQNINKLVTTVKRGGAKYAKARNIVGGEHNIRSIAVFFPHSPNHWEIQKAGATYEIVRNQTAKGEAVGWVIRLGRTLDTEWRAQETWMKFLSELDHIGRSKAETLRPGEGQRKRKRWVLRKDEISEGMGPGEIETVFARVECFLHST